MLLEYVLQVNVRQLCIVPDTAESVLPHDDFRLHVGLALSYYFRPGRGDGLLKYL